jgi:hypothetical protein
MKLVGKPDGGKLHVRFDEREEETAARLEVAGYRDMAEFGGDLSRAAFLGHMTGRQLLRRPGYEIDVEKRAALLRET